MLIIFLIKYMKTTPIAKRIAEKGIENVDLSMFSEDDKKILYEKAADILLRMSKIDEAFIALEKAGKLPVEELRKRAETKMQFGQYKEAYYLLMKTGQIEMAEFVKTNFL